MAAACSLSALIFSMDACSLAIRASSNAAFFDSMSKDAVLTLLADSSCDRSLSTSLATPERSSLAEITNRSEIAIKAQGQTLFYCTFAKCRTVENQ